MPNAITCVVLGRYAGVVGVLADVVRGDGIDVVATAGVDEVGVEGVRTVLADHPAAVVVVTLAPADPVVDLVVADGARPVVAVTWHPPDERPATPAGAVVVGAGRIGADLAAAVRSRG